jgi:hypothetical protein
MKCEVCGNQYPSRYWFHGNRDASPLICISCDPADNTVAGGAGLGQSPTDGMIASVGDRGGNGCAVGCAIAIVVFLVFLLQMVRTCGPVQFGS